MTGNVPRFDPSQPYEVERPRFDPTQPFTPEPAESKPLADVAMEAVRNVGPSAVEFAKNVAYPFMNPKEAGEGMWNLYLSTVAKGHNALPESLRGPSLPPQFEAPADAVGQHFKDRYGGGENIKGTVAKDPVGALADASVLLTGGAALPARIPGIIGQTAKTVGAVGRTVDPINVATRAAKIPGSAAAHVLGNTTGAGPTALKEAATAGKAGGDYAKDFLANLRGAVPAVDVVETAKSAVDQMRIERGDAYRAQMAGVTKDPTVLSFEPIDRAITGIRSAGEYKGKVIDEKASGTWTEIQAAVDDWRNSNPAEFHTPEGMDALKRKIGKIRDRTEFGKPDRVVADKAYHAIKDQIVKQAPDYGKAMKDYEAASDAIREMEKALSLNEKASADTALRKLQSIMRNNVNANYGQRGALGQKLAETGAPTLMPQLAGQALSSVAPRGLQGVGATGTLVGSLAVPKMAVALPFMSPRLMGEGAYYAGKLAGLPAASRQGSPTTRAVHDFLDPYSLRMMAYQAGEHAPQGQPRSLFDR